MTLAAYCFLDPRNFFTAFDVQPIRGSICLREDYAHKQYKQGLKIGQENTTVVIDSQNVWHAYKQGSHTQSYERIGYHANTKELLEGFLNSGVEILVRRLEDGQIETYRIQ